MTNHRTYGPSPRSCAPRPPRWLLVGATGENVAWICEKEAVRLAQEGSTVLGFLV